MQTANSSADALPVYSATKGLGLTYFRWLNLSQSAVSPLSVARAASEAIVCQPAKDMVHRLPLVTKWSCRVWSASFCVRIPYFTPSRSKGLELGFGHLAWHPGDKAQGAVPLLSSPPASKRAVSVNPFGSSFQKRQTHSSARMGVSEFGVSTPCWLVLKENQKDNHHFEESQRN